MKHRQKLTAGIKDLINRLPLFSSDLAVDILWHSPIHFRKAARLGQRPNWNGFMENIWTGSRHLPEKGAITMLPLMDLNSDGTSCIFQNLLSIKAPRIIFDQTFWKKAVEIVSSKMLNIVRLGGFHC